MTNEKLVQSLEAVFTCLQVIDKQDERNLEFFQQIQEKHNRLAQATLNILEEFQALAEHVDKNFKVLYNRINTLEQELNELRTIGGSDSSETSIRSGDQ